MNTTGTDKQLKWYWVTCRAITLLGSQRLRFMDNKQWPVVLNQIQCLSSLGDAHLIGWTRIDKLDNTWHPRGKNPSDYVIWLHLSCLTRCWDRSPCFSSVCLSVCLVLSPSFYLPIDLSPELPVLLLNVSFSWVSFRQN